MLLKQQEYFATSKYLFDYIHTQYIIKKIFKKNNKFQQLNQIYLYVRI